MSTSIRCAVLALILPGLSGVAMALPTAEDVIKFWFVEAKPSQWYAKNDTFDQLIRDRFEALHAKAHAGEADCWAGTPEGALALIIVLDQFSRNMYRGMAKAFASDAKALELSKEAISNCYHKQMEQAKASFLVIPHMHSENLADHDAILPLYQQPGWESDLEYEVDHRKILERFGRYPHRNAALGRKSTPEEIAYMKEDKGWGF